MNAIKFFFHAFPTESKIAKSQKYYESVYKSWKEFFTFSSNLLIYFSTSLKAVSIFIYLFIFTLSIAKQIVVFNQVEF